MQSKHTVSTAVRPFLQDENRVSCKVKMGRRLSTCRLSIADRKVANGNFDSFRNSSGVGSQAHKLVKGSKEVRQCISFVADISSIVSNLVQVIADGPGHRVTWFIL
jgi:hypothetical protein